MSETVCIVPVRDQPDLTRRFLDCVLEQALDRIIVLDNGSLKETRRILAGYVANHGIGVLERPGLGIYDLWNDGLEAAERAPQSAEMLEGLNLLVCNNDVVLPAGAVAELAVALRSRRDLWAVYPDDRAPWPDGFTRRGSVRLGTGVARDGGLYGPCFMLAVDRIPWRPLITDSAYEWWFGDNHLAREIEETGGKHGRLIGLPVLHDNEGTARHHPETLQMRNRDRQRWMQSQRSRRSGPERRRVVPGTKVWAPGGRRLDNE